MNLEKRLSVSAPGLPIDVAAVRSVRDAGDRIEIGCGDLYYIRSQEELQVFMEALQAAADFCFDK